MPPTLHQLVTFFEALPEAERREALMSLAEQSEHYEPREGEVFDLEDVRKDTECSDRVGIHVRQDDNESRSISFAISLGCKVQTLTRALTVLLCQGLSGASREAILGLDPGIISRVVGSELTQLRSRTIYYVLGRLKAAIAALPEHRSLYVSAKTNNKPA
jgi:cysteine desulfuration protein SufE